MATRSRISWQWTLDPEFHGLNGSEAQASRSYTHLELDHSYRISSSRPWLPYVGVIVAESRVFMAMETLDSKSHSRHGCRA
ncbi:hypothetical protein NL676_017694 [Syzygium grande]|nr:hypothetical protein NL676_017694 [Syzygium grande]